MPGDELSGADLPGDELSGADWPGAELATGELLDSDAGVASAPILVSVLVAATGTMVRVSKTGTGDPEDSLALTGLFAIETGELFALATAGWTALSAGWTALWAGNAGGLLAGATAYV